MPAIAVRQLLKRGITNKTIAHYVANIEEEEARARKQAYIKSQCRRIEDIDRNLKDRGGAADSSISKWKASLSKAQKLEVCQLSAERARVVKRLAKLKAKNDELVAEIEELESENIAIVEIAALDARDWCKRVDKQHRQKKRDERQTQINKA
jgi:cell division protein FtsB